MDDVRCIRIRAPQHRGRLFAALDRNSNDQLGLYISLMVHSQADASADAVQDPSPGGLRGIVDEAPVPQFYAKFGGGHLVPLFSAPSLVTASRSIGQLKTAFILAL